MVLKNRPEIKDVCLDFWFKTNETMVKDSLLLASGDSIIEINFITEEIYTVYEFENPIGR